MKSLAAAQFEWAKNRFCLPTTHLHTAYCVLLSDIWLLGYATSVHTADLDDYGDLYLLSASEKDDKIARG